MDIVYHIGTHCTDEDRLIRSLLRDRGPLAEQGVAVPAPGRYRPILRDTLLSLKGAPASAETQEVILDAIIGDDQPRRVVLSHDQFLGLPVRAISAAGFHARAARRVEALANLFPDRPCEFHMALRNPATLLPALIAQVPEASYASVLGDRDPLSLRWVQVVESIAAAVPSARLVVWCNEDAPVLWPDILRRLAAIPPDTAMTGDDDMLAAVLTPAGFKRMKDFLAANPPASADQRRRIASVFFDKFARPEAVEVDLPFPGWTENLVNRISEIYEADLSEIADIPGVEVLWV
jgi:hypothetical protein